MIIRYSMIQSFLECPAQFHRRYILGEPDKDKSSALEFGSAMHLGIRTILDGEDGISAFQMYWDSLKYTPMVYHRYDWQELRDLACNQFLPNFGKLHAKKFGKSVQEETIDIPFDSAENFIQGKYDTSGFENFLQGTYDLCGDYEGKLTIADWKTSTKEYDKNKIHRNPQMYIYAFLYQQKYKVLPEQLMYKVFIKSEGRIQTIKTPLTQEILDLQMQNVRGIIISMLDMIESGEYYCNFNHPFCGCKLPLKQQ